MFILINLCVNVAEISRAFGAEEKEDSQVRNGRSDHFCTHLYCLVPTPLYVTGEICSWSDQSASGCLHSDQHQWL